MADPRPASLKRAAAAAVLLAAAPAIGAPGDAGAQGVSDLVARVLEGAYEQVGVTVHYDGRYRPIPYPGGDVPADRGVCTDVIIRAYRRAGVDLQHLVHEDMTRAFHAYPRRWGLPRPDPNIDHRRVLNLVTFFSRHGRSLPISPRAGDYLPGDIVTWRLPSGRPHIGLVADRERRGRRLIVHNLGKGARIDDVLFKFPITGHYRYDPGHE